jgi:hypothetical protein
VVTQIGNLKSLSWLKFGGLELTCTKTIVLSNPHAQLQRTCARVLRSGEGGRQDRFDFGEALRCRLMIVHRPISLFP